ncbi:uncharacterized protein TRIADDRAFT_58568 [Trichoplax adhaerens]|uniref:Protein regulator of cytokinesis 1 n=1 Tax=Trichoplax adhaerens TaxID=10228 RepID=B3S322_TRIAD|nr:hypothetical protein TRIADDRAFT_58568 [Trichoplax adhaerens]EDV22718.1 hypothetical protein TRIADDRAFT_58568 [Trichoplax adhaerens]|eukprot:XP_002114584.1 hypothetical protein TRIADDRAFT_58568 [Trichoplax adhaerens]
MGTNLEMRENIISNLETSLLKLRAIWTEVGMTEEQKEERNQVVIMHMVSLLEQMVDEELDMKNKILANIKEFSRELAKICSELQVPQMKTDESLTLLEMEKSLRTEVDRLSLERHLRLKNLKTLVDDEDRICKRLARSLNPDRIIGVPTESRLNEYSQYVETIKKELEKRESMFISTKEVLVHLWDELEVTQTDDKETAIASSDANNYELSDSNMDYLKALITKYETQLKENEEKTNQLRRDVEHLWNRLDIEEEQREAFNEVTHGCKPSVITALELELDALNKMKLENLKKLVEKSRQDLNQWWDKCHFDSEERMKFEPVTSGETSKDYSEDLLNLHENEIKRITDYYSEHESYYQLVEHWYTLWNKWLEFEARANDPNRFGNRGGRLLQEEKLRRALNKEFPKVEKDLTAKMLKYEKEKSKPFCIDGQRFLDTIEALKEEHKLRKTQEKMDRQIAKERELQKELTYGAKPSPVKRRFAGTPVKTPTMKKQKVSTMSTGSAHSRVQSRINVPQSSKTPGRVKMAKGSRVTPAKTARSKNIRILKEVNSNSNEGLNLSDYNDPKGMMA